ncbi:hypothetical protein, partial [Tetragenococcus koreensis]
MLQFNINLGTQSIKNFTSNAVWRRGNLYVFEEDDPHFFIDVAHLQGETLSFEFDVMKFGTFSQMETDFLTSIQNRNEEIDSLREEVLEISQKHEHQKHLMTQRYNQLITSSAWKRHRTGQYIVQSLKNVFANQKAQQWMHYNVESLEYDADRHLTIVK